MSDKKESQKTGKFFEHSEKNNNLFFQILEDICGPLEYVSETNESVETFIAGKPPSITLKGYLMALGIDNGTIEEVKFDEFFLKLTAEKEWHGTAERERAKGFSRLCDLMKKNLEEIRVIRVGRVRIDIYVVGIDVKGRLTGVKTKALET